MTRRLTLLFFVLACLALSRSANAAADPVRLRVGVVADGIIRITPQDLAKAGVDPASIDPRTFALSSLGQPVAVWLSGEADGSFDAGDSILFFGQRFRGDEMAEKYTDERVYWLDIGGAPGPRISEQAANPTGDLTPPRDFAATVRAEQNKYWYTQHRIDPPTLDTWFWDQLQPFGAGASASVTLPYFIPYPAPDQSFELEVDENARSATSHRTTLALNGLKLVDEQWTGKARRLFNASAPAGKVVHGVNNLEVGAINPPGVLSDWVYINYWQLSYRRLFRAWQGVLDFTAETSGPHEYSITGWGTSDIAAWDITAPDQPKRLSGFSLLGGSGSYLLRFRAGDEPGARYWLQEAATFTSPASLRLRPDTGLRSPARGADTVIVTSAALRPAAEQLAQWHESHGRRAVVVDFLDLCDEFNDGIYHPRAAPAMLRWAREHWPGAPPQYLVLFGDGHWNFKDYNPALYPPAPIHIPPYLAWSDPWQGEVPADNLYADVDNDRRPDMAVGRIPANSLAEAFTIVAKIEAYDQEYRVATWQRRALFVADNADESGNFPAVSDRIISERIPGDFIIQRLYLGQTFPNAATGRTAIIDAINAGAFMVQYTGHGAPSRWTSEGMWTTADTTSLRNSGQLSVVMTFNCLDGYFAYPTPAEASVAEVMLRYKDGGSVAAISPTGLGQTADQRRFREFLMDVMFKDNVLELGTALMLAKQRYYDNNGVAYLVDTVTLFGDPALRLPGRGMSLYLPLYRR